MTAGVEGEPVRSRVPRRLLSSGPEQERPHRPAGELPPGHQRRRRRRDRPRGAGPRLAAVAGLARRGRRGAADPAPPQRRGRRLGLAGPAGQRAVPRSPAEPGPGVAGAREPHPHRDRGRLPGGGRAGGTVRAACRGGPGQGPGPPDPPTARAARRGRAAARRRPRRRGRSRQSDRADANAAAALAPRPPPTPAGPGPGARDRRPRHVDVARGRRCPSRRLARDPREPAGGAAAATAAGPFRGLRRRPGHRARRQPGRPVAGGVRPSRRPAPVRHHDVGDPGRGRAHRRQHPTPVGLPTGVQPGRRLLAAGPAGVVRDPTLLLDGRTLDPAPAATWPGCPRDHFASSTSNSVRTAALSLPPSNDWSDRRDTGGR